MATPHLIFTQSEYTEIISKAHSLGLKGTEYAKKLITESVGLPYSDRSVQREITNKKHKQKYFKVKK